MKRELQECRVAADCAAEELKRLDEAARAAIELLVSEREVDVLEEVLQQERQLAEDQVQRMAVEKDLAEMDSGWSRLKRKKRKLEQDASNRVLQWLQEHVAC